MLLRIIVNTGMAATIQGRRPGGKCLLARHKLPCLQSPDKRMQLLLGDEMFRKGHWSRDLRNRSLVDRRVLARSLLLLLHASEICSYQHPVS